MDSIDNLSASCKGVGLVLEGGGFRGIFTAGVLDTFLEQKLLFPYAVGVSAGAAYSVSYVSRQHGRNLEVNRRFTADPRYFSLGNYVKKRTFFDWEFVYKEVPLKHIPFDYKEFGRSSTRMRIGITNCTTGSAEFRNANGLSPDEFKQLLSATSALPFISQKIKIDGNFYMDGGIADSIPFEQAFADGCERLVIVLTRNAGYRKKSSKLIPLIKATYRNSPLLAEALATRSDRYNAVLDKIEALEQEGVLFVIRPKAPITVSRIENDPIKLEALYRTAQEEMKEVLPQLKKWLAEKVVTQPAVG
ncbi:MAG TPA: patatin family protein [Williamwhitmania sp.]|nr:patatin family protein [Williamwhitmania sp.]